MATLNSQWFVVWTAEQVRGTYQLACFPGHTLFGLPGTAPTLLGWACGRGRSAPCTRRDIRGVEDCDI